jgi:hypothetical protein
VFEGRVLKGIFFPKRENVTGGRRHKIMVILISLMRDHIEESIVDEVLSLTEEMRSAYKFLMVKLNILRARCTRKYNIKRDLKKQVLRL